MGLVGGPRRDGFWLIMFDPVVGSETRNSPQVVVSPDGSGNGN